MAKRKIIEIDRDKCDGCGLCAEACAEGALVLDEENKAILAKEIYCDGMGACLDVCPTDALKIVEKESEEYNPEAAYQHILSIRGKEAAENVHGIDKKDVSEGEEETPLAPDFPMGCPGSMAREIRGNPTSRANNPTSRALNTQSTAGIAQSNASELSQWPIQLHLVSPHAPYLSQSDLLIAADCTAFALGSFHSDLLRGKKLIIACPKLDDKTGYVEKIAEILKNNTIYSLTVAIMTVPCCAGLYNMVEKAVELSGNKINIRKTVIGLDGEIIS